MTVLSNVLPTIAITIALAGSTSGVAAQGASARHDKKFLPAAVTKAIQQNRPGAEVDKLDVDKEHGIVVYDIEFKAGQGEMDIAEDGTVLDIATVIDMKDVPEAAAAAIRAAAKGKAIIQLERSEVRAEIVTEGGKGRISTLPAPKYVYEAEFSRGEVEVTPEGKILKRD